MNVTVTVTKRDVVKLIASGDCMRLSAAGVSGVADVNAMLMDRLMLAVRLCRAVSRTVIGHMRVRT